MMTHTKLNAELNQGARRTLVHDYKPFTKMILWSLFVGNITTYIGHLSNLTIRNMEPAKPLWRIELPDHMNQQKLIIQKSHVDNINTSIASGQTTIEDESLLSRYIIIAHLKSHSCDLQRCHQPYFRFFYKKNISLSCHSSISFSHICKPYRAHF